MSATARHCIGNDPTCPCQDGDLCHYVDAPDGSTKAWPVPADRSLSQKMRDAGYTPRDRRLTCEECGLKVTAQFLPIHECKVGS